MSDWWSVHPAWVLPLHPYPLAASFCHFSEWLSAAEPIRGCQGLSAVWWWNRPQSLCTPLSIPPSLSSILCQFWVVQFLALIGLLHWTLPWDCELCYVDTLEYLGTRALSLTLRWWLWFHGQLSSFGRTYSLSGGWGGAEQMFSALLGGVLTEYFRRQADQITSPSGRGCHVAIDLYCLQDRPVDHDRASGHPWTGWSVLPWWMLVPWLKVLLL